MADIQPFKALRPAAQFAKKVASRPYDVLNSKEAKEEAAGNPESFLHITKSEIDLPVSVDIHSQEVYDKAKDNLTAFTNRGILFVEDKPCYYLYELTMNGQKQTGLVCVSSLNDYENDIIKKHEFTRPEKEQDRINHIKTTGAQTGNVFLAYRNISEVDEIVKKWTKAKSPLYDFTTDDNITHRVWIVNDNKTVDNITKLFKEKSPETYIADGHHRAASAAKVQQQKDDSSEYFLTTLFPASELSILDYNRVIKDLNGLSEQELLNKLTDVCVVEKVDGAFKPEKPGDFGMYLPSGWYKLTMPAHVVPNDPIGSLDISVLQDQILGPVFNIHDQRTDPRIDFVGGIRGMKELEKLVNNGDAKVAFSIFPVTMEQLFTVADSGNVMPPKSTWFEPKLRDGLLTHLINE